MISHSLLSLVPSRRGHFQMESGYHSSLWLDLEMLCRRPSAIQPYAASLADALQTYRIDAVCGPLNEGAFVAMMVASRLSCDFAYAERLPAAGGGALFSVQYRVPDPLRTLLHGRRVAIVNDVISAGSAVRGTFHDLVAIGAHVVAIASLLVLGKTIHSFAAGNGVPVASTAELPYEMWTPDQCPLCRSGVAVETIRA